MSTDATTPSSATTNGNHPESFTAADKGKGKGKLVQDDVMDNEEEDEEDEEEEEEEEEDDMEEDDDLSELDPSLIIDTSGRRTRGVRVDYSSAEALAKAGLKPEDAAEDDENEESFVARDEDMQD